MTKIIDGKGIANGILQEIKGKLDGRKPGLAFVLVGDDHASHTYVGMKKKACESIGFHSEIIKLPADVSEEHLVQTVQRLNNDQKIDGFLVQLPLPSHISTELIVSTIDPKKDVDGFHPMNLGKLLRGDQDGFVPCTPLGIATMLGKSDIDPAGKHVVIVGRSNIVGKPLAALLAQKRPGCNATVTLAHSRSHHLDALCREADILVAAIGKPHFIKQSMVKQGAIVIDVGINQSANGKLIGDVDYEHVAPKTSAITPVPGGVGPMTIAMLLYNTYRACITSE